jgi:hypothetical protein
MEEGGPEMLTKCREYRAWLIEVARGKAGPEERRLVMAHVELCADCARVLDEQLALSAALDGLAGERLPDMARIEAVVLAEFDRAAARRRASRWVFVAGLAAALLVGLVAVERRAPTVRPEVQVMRSAVETLSPSASVRPAVPVARVRHRVVRRPVSEESQPFMPIPYTVPLAPEEQATVVRMDVPVAALIAAGYSVETPDPGGVVNAEVLVSQDGRARAIRLNSKEEEKQ